MAIQDTIFTLPPTTSLYPNADSPRRNLQQSNLFHVYAAFLINPDVKKIFRPLQTRGSTLLPFPCRDMSYAPHSPPIHSVPTVPSALLPPQHCNVRTLSASS
ncbi:uncharacterized protein MYCGRDRAFT_97483 [Zymoseptoria tritici IPO323]|uniref:Uncharacterized protein n=1 Tax=Zymoseptoria tritici (strain CBS 115943 / IPO323) TaxID=336722 RepID=F9XQC6_ZYMTI|nr:uncharacterized protein MYCGRDRAFT_97483 [Zymoseptoria tritici IPO323]EGP82618.1 hypothetical protein MYCGRDRAFT_97483 [Zymoseptoria tritici IPO323]